MFSISSFCNISKNIKLGIGVMELLMTYYKPLSVITSFLVFQTGKVWNAWQLTCNTYGRNEICVEIFFWISQGQKFPKLMCKSSWKKKKWKFLCNLRKWYVNKCIFTLKRMTVHGCIESSLPNGCQVTSRPRDRFSRYLV